MVYIKYLFEPLTKEELMSKKNTAPSLETSLTTIAQLIETMEKGDLTLEQSLEHFERGVGLIKHCQQILQKAEQKVQILMQDNNKEDLAPYQGHEE